MTDKKFNKKCNAYELTKELRAAGFTEDDCSGVTIDNEVTIIHMKTEKNPESVVNAHIWKDPSLEHEELKQKLKADIDSVSDTKVKAILKQLSGVL